MVQTFINVNGQNVEASVNKPSSRSFRAAWQLDGGVISVDMEKARDIFRDQLRSKREPILQSLDVQMMRAMEEDEDASEIIAEKKRLRAVTEDSAIDDAETPEELEALELV